MPTFKNINFSVKMLYLPGTTHGYGIIDFHAIGTYEEIKIYSHNSFKTFVSLNNEQNIFRDSRKLINTNSKK